MAHAPIPRVTRLTVLDDAWAVTGAVAAYAPEASPIAGLRQHARSRGVEVILNANAHEHSLDQYTHVAITHGRVVTRGAATSVSARPVARA